MTLRPWHLLLVLAALIVPLQAGALSGGGSAGLAVSASLDYCGAGEGGISCKIDTTWSGVEDADRYTATVTLADGSVVDMGTVGSGPGGGATSIWVPFAGNGIYTVTVSAWGQDPDGKEKKIEEEDADTDVKDEKEKSKKDKDSDKSKDKAKDEGDEVPAPDGGADEANGGQPAEEPAESEEPPAPADEAPAGEPPAEEPPVPEANEELPAAEPPAAETGAGEAEAGSPPSTP